jgi:hypothetical protein
VPNPGCARPHLVAVAHEEDAPEGLDAQRPQRAIAAMSLHQRIIIIIMGSQNPCQHDF